MSTLSRERACLTMSTRTTVTVLMALAFAAGRTVWADEEAQGNDANRPHGLSASEVTFSDALAHYCRGLIAENADPASGEAEAQLEEAFRLDPGQIDTTLRLASRYQVSGRTNDLLRVLRAGCDRNPDDIGLRYCLGGAYQAAAQLDKALAEYRRLVERHPRNAAGYFGETQAYLLKNDWKRALDVLGTGIEAVTNSESLVAVCREFGTICRTAREWDHAVRCFSMLRVRNPDDPAGFLNLLEAYLRRGDKGNAAALLRKTPAKFRDSPRFDYVVARHYLATGNYKEALDCFERVEKAPDTAAGKDDLRDSAYYHQYGVACERCGRVEMAEKQFEKSVEMDAKNGESLNYLAYMWAERAANLDKASEYARRAVAGDPDNPAFIDTLGWIYFKRGMIDSALEQVAKAHEMMPEEPVIADHLGDILLARKETEKAIARWKESFLMDSDSVGVAKKLQAYGIDIRQLRKEAKAARASREKAGRKSRRSD